MLGTNVLFCVKHDYPNDRDYCGVAHAHPCYELVFYTGGKGAVRISDKEYEFSDNTFMITLPDVKHKECGSGGTEVLYIGFNCLGNVSLPVGLFQERDYGVKEFLDKIYYETNHWNSYSAQLIDRYCDIIVLKMLSGAEKLQRIPLDHSLDNIVQYISVSYQDDLKIGELARMAGYSYDHFRKIFFKRFNMSVNDYILQKRLEAATNMLHSKQYLIKEIAHECGFSSASQFCTKYREVMGISPLQLQKQIKEKSEDIQKDKFSD